MVLIPGTNIYLDLIAHLNPIWVVVKMMGGWDWQSQSATKSQSISIKGQSNQV